MAWPPQGWTDAGRKEQQVRVKWESLTHRNVEGGCRREKEAQLKGSSEDMGKSEHQAFSRVVRIMGPGWATVAARKAVLHMFPAAICHKMHVAPPCFEKCDRNLNKYKK